MATSVSFRSPYDLRVDLVKDTITAHSKLKGDDARELAVHILQALQSVPERIR